MLRNERFYLSQHIFNSIRLRGNIILAAISNRVFNSKISPYHPSICGRHNLVLPRVGGYSNHRNMPHDQTFFLVLPNIFHTSQSIHDRHLKIHQNDMQLLRVSSRVNPEICLADEVQCLFTVIRDTDNVTSFS